MNDANQAGDDAVALQIVDRRLGQQRCAQT